MHRYSTSKTLSGPTCVCCSTATRQHPFHRIGIRVVLLLVLFIILCFLFLPKQKKQNRQPFAAWRHVNRYNHHRVAEGYQHAGTAAGAPFAALILKDFMGVAGLLIVFLFFPRAASLFVPTTQMAFPPLLHLTATDLTDGGPIMAELICGHIHTSIVQIKDTTPNTSTVSGDEIKNSAKYIMKKIKRMKRKQKNINWNL